MESELICIFIIYKRGAVAPPLPPGLLLREGVAKPVSHAHEASTCFPCGEQVRVNEHPLRLFCI